MHILAELIQQDKNGDDQEGSTQAPPSIPKSPPLRPVLEGSDTKWNRELFETQVDNTALIEKMPELM